MDKEPKQNLTKRNSLIIIIVCLIICGLFLWYQLRPAIIYSLCDKKAQQNALSLLKSEIDSGFLVDYRSKTFIENLEDAYELYYKKCLRSYGFNK